MSVEEYVDYSEISHVGSYTIRLDNISADKIREFFNKYTEYERYCISDEVATVTGKQHMQGIIEFGRELDKKEEAKHRARISSFFSRKGSEFSFRVVKEYHRYFPYIMKQDEIVSCVGYSEDEIKYWKAKQESIEKKIESDKRKREVKKQQLKPMEMLYEYYEPFYLEEYDKYKKTHIDADHTQFLGSSFSLAKHVVRHVMIYWGEMAHKCFMINKIAEASDYVCFRIMRKYSESKFEEHMLTSIMNVQERMSFCKY